VSQSLEEGQARQGVAWLVISAAAYGSLVILIKIAVAAQVNGETAMALRFTAGGLFWWLFLLARRRPFWPGLRQAALMFGLGALVFGPNALAFYLGTARLPASLATMTVAAAPVMVGALAWLLLGERMGWMGRVALAVVVVGGVILAGVPEGRADPLGLLWLGMALLLYTVYVVAGTPLVRALSPPLATALVLSGSAAFYWLWGGLGQRLDFTFAASGWIAVLGMVLIATILAMFAFLQGVEILGATRAVIVGALEPVVGVILSVIFLHERPGLQQIIGGTLIILAAFLVQRERARTRAEPQE